MVVLGQVREKPDEGPMPGTCLQAEVMSPARVQYGDGVTPAETASTAATAIATAALATVSERNARRRRRR
jgi:hypothetical protein